MDPPAALPHRTWTEAQQFGAEIAESHWGPPLIIGDGTVAIVGDNAMHHHESQ